MKKILVAFCLMPTLVFGQMWSELSKLMTCIDSTTWATYDASSPTTMNKRISAATLNTYVVSKGTSFTSIPIGSGTLGSIFFKQTSTGNFSTSNKFYFDSTNTRLMLGGTGLSHSTQSRLTVLADSGSVPLGTDGYKEMIFNYVDPSVNKNRSTVAEASDSSSFNLKKTYSGKMELVFLEKSGNVAGAYPPFVIDTSGSVGFGVRNNIASTGFSVKIRTNLGIGTIGYSSGNFNSAGGYTFNTASPLGASFSGYDALCSRTGSKLNAFCFTDKDINKQVTSYASMKDTSAFSMDFTSSTGKPQLLIKDNVGATTFQIDSVQNIGIGGAAAATKVQITGSLGTTTTIHGGTTVTAGQTMSCPTGMWSSAGYVGAYGNLLVGVNASNLVCNTANVILGNSYRQILGTNGITISIVGNHCKAATANLNGGELVDSTGRSTGSGSASIKWATSGGGLTGGTADLYPTIKMILNGVGGLIYTPLNTTKTGADSLTAGGGIVLTASATVSNMGAFDLRWNGRVNIDISANPQIDTTNATDGQVIKVTNSSPTGKTLLFENNSGVLLNGGTSFTMSPGDVIQFTCIKINGRKWWREDFRSDCTVY